MQQTQKYCTNCKGNELHARPGTNHLLHLLITMLLCGFWLPIWILSALKFGGWRCQRCGSGSQGFSAITLLAAVLILCGVLLAKSVVSSAVNSASTLKANQTVSEEPLKSGRTLPQTEEKPKPPVLSAPLKTEQKVKPIEPSAKETFEEVKPIYLESLKDVTIPVKLEVIETFNLLDAAGKEVPIPVAESVVVQKRTPGGTLTMVIGGKPYVGHESRLSKKVRIASN